jgi:outer membrane protein assembly factor BamA
VISKNIDKGKLILKSNEILINGKSISKDSLKPLLVQNQNNYFLGFPLSASLYESSKKNSDSIFNSWINKKSKRKKRLNKVLSKKQVLQIKNYIKNFNNWKKRNGEELQLIDSTKTKISTENLKSYFKNNGYFDAKISSKVEINNDKYGKVIYDINLGNQYYLDSIKSNIQSSLLDSIYLNNLSKSYLIKNNFFNTLDFESERNRLDKLFKNSGIYNFQISSISFQVSRDTVGLDLRIPVQINISENSLNNKNSIIINKYRIHQIKKINVYTNNFLSISDENLKNPVIYDSINIFSKGKLRYKPENLINLISFKKGDNYSDIQRSKTIKQLNNLENFQYPSVSYNYLEGSKNQLEANILLNPKKRFSLGFGFDLKHSNIEDIGIAFATSFTSRNIFQGAERLEISSRGTIGKSGNTTISEYGIDVRLKFPRLFIPISSKKLLPLEYNPNTYISLGTSKQTNIGLDRQSFKFDINYDWLNKNDKKINLGLLNIELVNNKNSINYFNIYTNSYNSINSIAINSNTNNSYFDSFNKLKIPKGINSFINDVINQSITLELKDYNSVNYINDRRNRLTSNNLIIGSSFSIISDNRKSVFDESFSQFKFKAELAGSLTNFLANQLNAPLDEYGNRKILGLAYSQYFKTELNYIKHWGVSSNSTLAIRAYYGIAIPFGNSDNIPFSKSFFSGGSNDNRAWEVYRLGPGSSGAVSEFNEANMKIAFNIEYRFGLIGKIDGAIFTDIGNIWNVYDNTSDPKRTFNGLKDLNEIAIGSGIGLRYNLGYFVLRLDMGLKAYNPALDLDKRWLTDFNLKKAVFNIGLNYPF